MVDNAFYLVSEAIAQRSGVIEDRFRIADGRFVLDTKDLSRIRLTSEEYVNGLAGVEQVSKQEAMILIKDNGNQMGTIKPIVEAPKEVVEKRSENNEQPNNEEVQEETQSEESVKQESEAPLNEEEATQEENEEQEEN